MEAVVLDSPQFILDNPQFPRPADPARRPHHALTGSERQGQSLRSLTNPPDPLKASEREKRVMRRLTNLRDRMLDSAGWPAERTAWVVTGNVDAEGRYDPLRRRYWMTVIAKGYRLKVEVPDIASTIPSPDARRAADLLRALRAALG